MADAFDADLRRLALDAAGRAGVELREGVYIMLAGPNYETRAEMRMLRGLGGDAVGMSTVPEVLVAVHAGMKVLGFSIVTDRCLPDALEPVRIEDVIAVANAAEGKLRTIVRGVLERIDA
jgi:purine-nucleoside phosphorylase